MYRISLWRVLGLMGLKMLYGLVVLESPPHMRDHHGLYGRRRNSASFSFSSLSSNRRGCVMLFNSPRLLASVWNQVEGGLESETIPSHFATPHSATQYNMDDRFTRDSPVCSHLCPCYVLTDLLSATVVFVSPATIVLGLCFPDRKSTRLNSSHQIISYAVFCLKKKNNLIVYSC